MKKTKQFKVTSITLGVLLLASIFFSITLYFSTVSKQEVIERKELLTISLEHLYNANHTINIGEIEEIKVLKAKAGAPPMNYNVALNMKNGDHILYSWLDDRKSGVTHNAN